MKYSVSYEIPEELGARKHVRYYDALDKATALEMFAASCEESLIGENPQVVEVKEVRTVGCVAIL